MVFEIERKFLVSPENLPDLSGVAALEIQQGYLKRDKPTVRVRTKGSMGFLTVKGPSRGISREEFEYEIPLNEALHLLALCQDGLVEKVRYLVPWEHHTLEVDVFKGRLSGLVIAEVEFKSESDSHSGGWPHWFGPEVSEDPRYANSSLSDPLREIPPFLV